MAVGARLCSPESTVRVNGASWHNTDQSELTINGNNIDHQRAYWCVLTFKGLKEDNGTLKTADHL